MKKIPLNRYNGDIAYSVSGSFTGRKSTSATVYTGKFSLNRCKKYTIRESWNSNRVISKSWSRTIVVSKNDSWCF